MQLLQTPLETALQRLTEHHQQAIQEHEQVLFLVSGGSNTTVAIDVLHNLSENELAHVTLALIDERFGPVGHPDSNFTQLEEAGLRDYKVTAVPVLQPGKNLEQTADLYDETLQNLFANHYVVGLLGIGPDGHTSGILPHSPAAEELSELVTSYRSDPYERITTTFTAIRRLDEVFVFAYGEAKAATLKLLATTDRPLADQPAQIFKALPTAIVFNDQIGETV